MSHILDNPVWNALSETHRHLCIEIGNFRLYHPTYCPFGALQKRTVKTDALPSYDTDNFFIVGKKPGHIPSALRLKHELICEQMVIEHPIETTIKEEIIPLNGRFEKELSALINLVQPGYFKDRTHELGDYFGVFHDGKLVAVAGERMKTQTYTEVSAVVTHPLYIGRGYASQVVSVVVNKIFSENKIPFLHVSTDNNGAISLYKKLGFTSRRPISFWHYVKQQEGTYPGNRLP